MRPGLDKGAQRASALAWEIRRVVIVAVDGIIN